MELSIPDGRDNNFWYVYNDSDTVVVFVHGIFSNSRTCWLYSGAGRTMFWPDLIRADPRFDAPSIYLAGYYTAIDAGDFPINQCARDLLETLERPDVTGRPPVLAKKQIIFVCHSTGGIVVRYLLCRYGQAFRGKGVGLALIASPSRGSVWANVAGIAARYYNQSLGSQLQWNGETIEEIHSLFKDLVNARDAEMPGLFGMEACETQMVYRRSIPGAIRWLLPTRLKVVTTESAGQYFGQVKYLAGTDHFSSVKPDGLTHPSHEFLETFVRRFRQFLDGRQLSRHGAPVAVATTAPAGEPRDQGLPATGSDRVFDADYFDAQQQIIDEHANRHVGRAQVEETLRKFMRLQPRGYFFVTSGPGFGKTAFACHLTKKHGLIHHLIKRSGDRADPRLIVCSLLNQMSARTGAPVNLTGDLPALTKAFEALLKALAKTSGPVIVVIDALDEMREEAGSDLPFLPGDALPDGVYFLITSRPDARLEALREGIVDVPQRTFELAPLDQTEVGELLEGQGRYLAASEVAWIAETSRGSPLYLRALSEELTSNPHFDLNELPPAVEDYFRRAIGRLPERGALTEVVGLIAAARAPLSERDLAEITGLDRSEIHEKAVRPISPFLLETGGGYSFYHESFAAFVQAELVDATAARAAHVSIAQWLMRPEQRGRDYTWRSLAYHLFEAGDGDRFLGAIDEPFLREKVRRFGFAVLDDVELLTRWLIEAGEPGLLERSVGIVERLRTVAGGDLMADVERAVQFAQVVPRLERVAASRRVTTAAVDVYVGMIPKIGVSADFAEVVAVGSRLWIAIGDVPASGLKSAFAARFVANLFRRLASTAPSAEVGPLLTEIGCTLRPFDYFDRISMQCLDVDPDTNRVYFANAGHPDPVLYSAERQASDRLPVKAPLLGPERGETPYATRSAEIGPGDVLVLVSDGLTEGGRLQDPYGYRFVSLLERHASESPRAIGERILADWRAHPRSPDWIDDVTVVVAAIRPRK